jgi:hypothetical integral membrane protein (TIGR02206 family)
VSGFEPFGLLHGISALALAAAIAAMSFAGRRLRASHAGRAYELTLSFLVVALWVGYQVYDALTTGFDIRSILPLQLCDISAIVAALVFAFPNRPLHTLAWFWGLGLSSQAVFTPDLVGGPETLGFWAFWLYHLFVIGAGVYVVAVRGFRPRWPDLRLALLAGIVYVVVVFTIDVTFDVNYGYLGRSNPGQPTILDLLGPWPLRVVYMMLLGALAMTLLWVPWLVAARAARSVGRAERP